MSKLKRVVLTLTAPLLFTACGDDTAGGPDPNDDLCEIDGPTRLLAAPDGWQPAEFELNFFSVRVDDRLLYSFLSPRSDGLVGDVYLRDLCGGEPERVLAGDSRIAPSFVHDLPDVGPVLYGWRASQMYVIDRLDVPGADAPRPVPGLELDPDGNAWSIEHWPQGPVFVGHVPGTGGLHNAAGIGAVTSEVLTLGPTPDSPAALLGDNVVRKFPFAGGMAVHTDDGRLFVYEYATGERTPIADDVRWASTVAIGERALFLIQDIVDGVAEPVRLLDPETGEARQVAVNDFVDRSFGRDPEHGSAGTWTGFRDDDGAFIALYGPDGPLIEGHDVATLEPIEIPDNIGLLHISGAPWLGLIVPDPTDTVYAAWTPATGELREWYRGPKPEFDPGRAVWKDGALEYTTEISDGIDRVSRYDERTGETTVVLPRRGGFWYDLEDGRIVTAFPNGDLNYDVVVIDRETAKETTLVRDVHEWQYDKARALVVYTDFTDPEPGLWAAPIPPR